MNKILIPPKQRYDNQNNAMNEEIPNHILVAKINQLVDVVTSLEEKVNSIININFNTLDNSVKKELIRMANKIEELNSKIKELK